MEVKVEVKLTKKEMFNFLLRHNYTTFGGICGIVLSIGALVMFFLNLGNEKMSVSYKVALIAVALLFTVVQPIMLYFKAATQIKNSDAINKPMVYEFNKTCVTITQGEDSVTNKYEDITKVISTKVSVIIYVSKYRAFIIPKASIGEDFETLKDLLVANVKARTVTVK